MCARHETWNGSDLAWNKHIYFGVRNKFVKLNNAKRGELLPLEWLLCEHNPMLIGEKMIYKYMRGPG